MVTNDTITINRQDSYIRTINIKDSSGNFIDATGWTIYFTVRKTISDTSVTDDTGAVITEVISGDVSGIQTLNLSSTQTDIDAGDYLYDIQIVKPDTTVSSSTKALFIVDGDITRTT